MSSEAITPPQPVNQASSRTAGSNMTADGRSTNWNPGQFSSTSGGTNGTVTFDRGGAGAPAATIGTVDVTGDYPWTLSKKKGRDDIPEIILYEHRNEESAIKRQIMFYGQGTVDSLGQSLSQNRGFRPGASPGDNLLKVYQDIFPDNPTGNKYYFPYFSKTFLELTSPQWEQLDDIGASIDNLLDGTGSLAQSVGNLIGKEAAAMGTTAKRWMEGLKEVRQAGAAGFETLMKTQYPVVGIFDRPRIFSSHNEREIKIEFPLYNTIDLNDWKRNRDLVYQLMTQFLYIKNSYITGYPPVFYRVLIPGEYFSFASCVTNFTVSNLGNIRKLYGYNVPDAYQFSLTLKEMCMPSLNQFQAMTSGEAAQKVSATIASGVAPGARGRI